MLSSGKKMISEAEMNPRQHLRGKASFKSILGQVYKIISVISTLTVTLSLVLFIGGRIVHYNMTDDDLILDGIQNAISDDYSIEEIHRADLHGLGSDSLIVIARKDTHIYDFYDSDIDSMRESEPLTQLLFFDEINNSFLQEIYNLFGFGSRYSLRYRFSLADDNIGPNFYAEVSDIIDLTKDGRPEIIVNFVWIGGGGSEGYYQHGIFSYSIVDRKYHLVGTYPPRDLDAMGQFITTPVVDGNNLFGAVYNYYDQTEKFLLGWNTSRNNAFFWDTGQEIYLIQTEYIWGEDEAHSSPHAHYLFIYRIIDNWYPSDNITWECCYSGEIPGKRQYCTDEFLVNYIMDNNILEYCY